MRGVIVERVGKLWKWYAVWYIHEDIRLIVLIWEVIFTVILIKAWVRR